MSISYVMIKTSILLLLIIQKIDLLLQNIYCNQSQQNSLLSCY